MLTLEVLKKYDIDYKEGLTRCMNNEKFYIKMIGLGLSNEYFETLEKALADGRLDDAFEAAHALKGVIGNLAIAPLYNPLAEITEMLREKKDTDYVSKYQPVKKLRDELLALHKG